MISDQPICIPDESQMAWKLNAPFIFKPGTVVFLPVTDVTFEYLNLFFHVVDQEKAAVIDDIGPKPEPAGVAKYISDGTLTGLHLPLSFIETQVPAVVYTAGAFMVQSLQLAQAAMGLGGYPLRGYQSIILFGGTPFLKCLGFKYAIDKKGFPYPYAVEGHFYGHCPPAMSIEDAVMDLWNVRFNPDCGRYSPTVAEGQEVPYPGLFPEKRAVYHPFRDVQKYVEKAIPYSEKSLEVVIATAKYLYEKYGRLPALAEPFMASVMVDISHVDVRLYEQYAKESSVWQDHYDHFKVWHSGYQPT